MIEDLTKLAKQFLDLILNAQHVVALTGAGISTESGIPDYRSPNTGLWENMNMSVVSISGFLQDPSQYYKYSLKHYPIRSAAKPNSAHKLLGYLERKGLLKGVITQNVDGLHWDGGSERVYELHGSLRQAVCLGCCLLYSMEEVMSSVMRGQNPPHCSQCGGILKPNAVFFGEPLPIIPWKESLKLCKKADLLIVMGSSLQVSPANTLPNIVLDNNGRLVICNLQPTSLDAVADLIVREKIGEFATLIVDMLARDAKDT